MNLEVKQSAALAGEFGPYDDVGLISAVPGLRVFTVSLARDQHIPWHRVPRSTVTIFANMPGLAVEVIEPHFRTVLGAGEYYSVPADLAMTIYSSDGTPSSFTVFQYGESFASVLVEPPATRFRYQRTPPMRPAVPRPVRQTAALDGYRLGLTTLDVLASPPNMRLLVQGHGEFECAPWHSHDVITDTFFVCEGYALIATRDPDETHILGPGDIHEVRPGTTHLVGGVDGQPCLLLVLQGVGEYNSVERLRARQA